MLKLWKGAKPTSQAKSVRGWFRGQGQLVSGWAVDDADPGRKLDIEILVDGQRVGSARADRFDPMVQEKEGGDGLCGFAFYYAPPPSEAWTEAAALALEQRSATELRTKQPQLQRMSDGRAPLTIHHVALPNVRGAIAAYPVRHAMLEIWSGDRRIASGVELQWVDRKAGIFTTRLPEEALIEMQAKPIELALPGLKEAGLAVALHHESGPVGIRFIGNRLSVQLPAQYAQVRPATVALKLKRGDETVAELTTTRHGDAETAAWPSGLASEGVSIDLIVDGSVLPTAFDRVRDLALADSRFDALVAGESPWSLSGGQAVEGGFFAFPAPLADQFGLSGHIVRLSRTSDNEPIRLTQQVREELVTGDVVRTVAMFRSAEPGEFTLRLRDDTGVIDGISRSTKGENVWLPLPIEVALDRPVAGELRVEIEARANDVFIGLSGAGTQVSARGESDAGNLVVNGGLDQWPAGTAVLSHEGRGEVCDGWRVRNQKSVCRVLSQPAVDAEGSPAGVAVAAAEIPARLWIEADLSDDPANRDNLRLTFRAGVPPEARAMLRDDGGTAAEFMQISRIMLIRRAHVVTADGVLLKEQIGPVIAKKVAVTWEPSGFSFALPKVRWPAPEQPLVVPNDTADLPEGSHHLVFELRGSSAIAVYDVRLTNADTAEEAANEPMLGLEDRNITLQIPRLRGFGDWTSSSPIKAGFEPSRDKDRQLKWGWSAFREPVEIVIPVFNAFDETRQCLDSLGRSSSFPILVRLVDDGSDGIVVSALKDYVRDKPWMRLHSFGRNRGYTHAADFGVRNAQSPWVVLLNSDTIVTRGWLEGMLDCARSDPAIGLVGPLSNAATYQSVPDVYDADGTWKVNELPPGLGPDDMAEIVREVSRKEYPEAPLLNGFCTLIKRSLFDEIGGLDHATFPMGYGEENDLCIRARKAGAKLAIADDVYVFHHKSASFGDERRKLLSAKGGDALARLHPDVDIGELTGWFRDMPALAAVREGVSDALRKRAGVHDHLAPSAAA